ncbi:hypothetical protein FEM08_24010 [Flavobacterium gilvum]|nr:hypothetical protein FEM08_24010 [Flavobacterium gilvum]
MQIGNKTASSSIIIAGTLGKSEAVDALVKQEGTNVSALKGQWESFLIKVISPTKLLVVGK